MARSTLLGWHPCAARPPRPRLPVETRGYGNGWIAKNRYEGHVTLTDDAGMPLGWPFTNCVRHRREAVGRKLKFLALTRRFIRADFFALHCKRGPSVIRSLALLDALLAGLSAVQQTGNCARAAPSGRQLGQHEREHGRQRLHEVESARPRSPPPNNPATMTLASPNRRSTADFVASDVMSAAARKPL